MAVSLVMALVFGSSEAQAQRRSSGGSEYTNAAGFHVDFGDGTLVGFSGKHFFSDRLAGQALILFGSGTNAAIGADLQYHVPISSASGLQWYAGGGMIFQFLKFGGGTLIGIRPQAGLDYKLQTAPINFSFDWRPIIGLNKGVGFVGARFGLTARYTF